MIVIGVPSWLGTGLDVGGGASDQGSRFNARFEIRDSRVDDSSSVKFTDNEDRHCHSVVRNSIWVKGKIIVMLERMLILFRYFVCLSLITHVGFPVYAVTNPKGDISVNVKVPKELEVGGNADLRCEWKIKGDKNLYSVKWYKDDHEFFRFVPTNQERIQTFAQQGVQLVKKAISEKSIWLSNLNLTLNSTGQYKCEVSTEGPSFATEYKTGNLTVIVLPSQGPVITGLSSHYAVGENVTANCTAWPSVPKANLHWTINGKPISSEYTIPYPPSPSASKLSGRTSLGLRIDAEPRHFEGSDGSVSIRCVSYVGTKRNQTEVTVHMAHVNNQRLSAGDLRGAGTSVKIIQSSRQHWLGIILVLVSLCFAT